MYIVYVAAASMYTGHTVHKIDTVCVCGAERVIEPRVKVKVVGPALGEEAENSCALNPPSDIFSGGTKSRQGEVSLFYFAALSLSLCLFFLAVVVTFPALLYSSYMYTYIYPFPFSL